MIPAENCFAPVMLEARGATLRAAHFAAEPTRGICVLMGGQTEFIEKYFEVIDELRARGFGVVTFDWRGQGGSQRLLADPMKAHVADFSQYDEDLDAVMEQMVTPLLEKGTRVIALAHSMGGHILLRALAANPSRFAAAAFSAPMVQFSTGWLPHWFVTLVTGWKMAGGKGEDFVWGMGNRDPLTLPFEKQVVTSDPVRFARNQDELKLDPHLRLGGPTWSWLHAATRSVARMAAPDFAKAITTSALICGAGHDLVCVSRAARDFAAQMPNGRYVEIAGACHEILMERDGLRALFWAAFDQWMLAP